MNEIANIADHAAQQSDRWLFIATLLLLMGFAILIWRWVIADREKLSKRLTEMTDKHITATEQMAVVVANNTTALHEVKEVMAACRYRQAQQ
jgi:peptidoglycan/LPS O-acetylase OafA/YrhL